MATVTKGRTFVSGETVTPAKLNELVDNATVTSIVDADVSASAAIALSKLATGALPTAITVASANLVDGTIVNADINASAAIAGSKLADAGITAAKLDGAQTGSAPIYGCRAWVNFNGTRNATDTGASTNGANVHIRASGNVASVLKNSTGNYTITFASAMQDASYAITGMGLSPSGGYSVIQKLENGTSTSSAIQIVSVGQTAGSPAVADRSDISVAIFR